MMTDLEYEQSKTVHLNGSTLALSEQQKQRLLEEKKSSDSDDDKSQETYTKSIDSKIKGGADMNSSTYTKGSKRGRPNIVI